MKNIISLFVFCFLLVSCEQKRADGTVVDTPTKGNLKLMVEEGYQPVITSVLEVFSSLYSMAHFDAKYVAEGDAVRALLNDSTEVIIIPRNLKPEEVAYFKSKGFTPRENLVAHDAVAFITNPGNRDSVLTVDQIRDIVTGKVTKWSQINPKSTCGAINLVFDNANSANVRYCRDSIGGGAPLPANASALKKNEDVIAYVSKNKGAFGIIGANWVSDSDDKGVQSFLKEVMLVDVAQKAGAESYGPYQAYLANKLYPFRRSMYIINCQARAGLGLGLANFLISDPGQRIMMKEGLLAANVPIRLMQVIKE